MDQSFYTDVSFRRVRLTTQANLRALQSQILLERLLRVSNADKPKKYEYQDPQNDEDSW